MKTRVWDFKKIQNGHYRKNIIRELEQISNKNLKIIKIE